LVPEAYLREVLKIEHPSGQFASRCRSIDVPGQVVKVPAFDETSRATGSRRGGMRGYHLGEAEQYTKSGAKYRMVKLEPEKVGVMTYASDEILEDAFVAMGTLILQLAAEELAFIQDDEIVNGTGANQPLGVLNANCLVSVVKETNQAAKTIVYENIVKMYAQMHRASLAKGVWFINPNCLPELFTMALGVGTGGSAAYIPPAGLAAAPYGTLMGLPVQLSEMMATCGTVGDIGLWDMKHYLLATKGGVKTAMSEHLRFDYDQQVFKASIKYDGQPGWTAALTPYKDASTSLPVSPFVCLASRA